MFSRKWTVTSGALLAIGALAGVAFGLGSADTPGPHVIPLDIQPVSISPVTNSTRALVAPSEELPVLLRTMQLPAVVDAQLGAPPADAEDGAVGTPWENSPWLSVSVRVPSLEQGAAIEPLWEADLLQGALAEQGGETEDDHDALSGSTFVAELPDGSLTQQGGGIGNAQRGQEFAQGTDEEVDEQITQVLASAGLSLINISVMHAPSPAPALIVETSDPQKTLSTPGLEEQLFTKDGLPYVGYYLEVRTLDGNVAGRYSMEARSAVNAFWTDPKYRTQSTGS